MGELKNRKNLLSLIGIVLSLLAAVLYAVFYGAAKTNMNNMSWPAFGLLVAAGAVGLLLVLVRLGRWAPRLGQSADCLP